MIDRRIGKIKVRRGTDSQRKLVSFEEGELVYSIDKQRLYIGNGTEKGGILVSNRNYVKNSLGVPPVVPNEVSHGDIVYDKSNAKTYITKCDASLCELILIADAGCCARLQIEIDDLYDRLRTLLPCATSSPPPSPPLPTKLTWYIEPSNISINLGETATFTASAIGVFGLISYKWNRKDGIPISVLDNQPILTFTSQLSDEATYYCVANTFSDSITSKDATLNIGANSILAEDGTFILSELSEYIDWEFSGLLAPTIITHPRSQVTSTLIPVTFSVVAGGSDPLSYQWKINGANLVGEIGKTHTITNPTKDISGITCVVSNLVGSVETNPVSLTVGIKPSIVTQPISQSIAIGSPVTFSVVAGGSTPLSYQWNKNGSPIVGATNSTYTINLVTNTDFGNYICVVSNPYGSVDSDTVNLKEISSINLNNTKMVIRNRVWTDIAMSSDGTIQTAVAGDGYIYNSTDSGDTWIYKETKRTWSSIAMSSDGKIQIAGYNGDFLIISTDYGNNWTPKLVKTRLLAMSSDGTKQTAIGDGQIYISTDSGNTWTPKETNRIWKSIAMSSDGTKQTAVVGRLYSSSDSDGQIYISTDSGNTWTPKESNRNWESIAMSSDGTKQTAVVRGDKIYISTDSGNTWTPKESNRNWQSIAMSSDGTKQTAVANFGKIYISTDSGNTWTPKETDRRWNSVAMSSDGTKQTAVAYDGQIYISTDSGNTWKVKESIFEIFIKPKFWGPVAMSSDGKIKTALVQTNGRIYVSIDSGYSWTPKESNRNWRSIAMSSDGKIQIAIASGDENIYISKDSGNTWTAKKLGNAAVSFHSIAMSFDGKIQMLGMTNGEAYISIDSGNTWANNMVTRYGDTDTIRSLKFSSDGKIRTAIVRDGKIYVSSGNTWTTKESNRNWQSIAMSSDGTKQTAVVYDGKIYISTDSGNTWTPKETNRKWKDIAMSSDGKIQIAPVEYGRIYISTDYGNTWTPKETDRRWNSVAISPDGKISTFSEIEGYIYESTDFDNNFKIIGA